MENNEKKNDKGFSKGVTLIIIGVIFTLVTLFDFELDWYLVAKMWPLLLIIIGVCIMPINKWIRLAITIALLAFGAALYQQKADVTRVDRIEIRKGSHPRIIFDDDDDFDDD